MSATKPRCHKKQKCKVFPNNNHGLRVGLLGCPLSDPLLKVKGLNGHPTTQPLTNNNPKRRMGTAKVSFILCSCPVIWECNPHQSSGSARSAQNIAFWSQRLLTFGLAAGNSFGRGSNSKSYGLCKVQSVGPFAKLSFWYMFLSHSHFTISVLVKYNGPAIPILACSDVFLFSV